MVKSRASSTLPRLMLTHREEDEMRELGDALEREVVDMYEQFLFRRRRRIDTTRWKAVRSQGDVHVFSERDDFRKTWRHTSKLERTTPGPMATLAASSHMPLVLATGTVQGSLDDALFGNSFIDTPSLRVRDAYLAQKTDDAAVLAVIDAPQDDDPFGFLGISWFARKSPLGLGRARDFLLLTGVRSTTLSNGERIGVAFHHSVEHPDLPECNGVLPIVRAAASLVAVYRQLDEGRVDIFTLDLCDLLGNVPSSSTVKQSLAMLVPRANSCDAGVKKKLHWLMRERYRAKMLLDPTRDSAFSSSMGSVMNETRVDVGFCDICDSTLRSSGMFSSSSAICQLCGEHVCSKCVVSKSIAMDASSPAVETKRFAFCVACMHHAKSQSAADIALRQIEDMWTQSMAQSMVRKRASSDSERPRPTSLIE